MNKTYAVAREVRISIEGAPQTFSGQTPTRLSFEYLARGLTRRQASELAKYHNSADVVFFKE